MEMACPEVYAIPADDPLEMLRFLAVTRLFDTLAISAEDALRAKSYAAASARKRLQGQASDLDDFLRSLELVVDIGTLSDSMLGRFAQLTQKTNQFNLTTRRYSEEQVRHMLQEGSFELFYCACRDRFADEGVTGAAIIRKNQREWVIETFLLSCRVLGRGVERAFLAFICAQGFRARATRVLGEFIRTNKNAQTATFYRDNGFSMVTETEERSLWELALPPPATMWPEWIQESHLQQHVTA
jgi:FkbH-like protein